MKESMGYVYVILASAAVMGGIALYNEVKEPLRDGLEARAEARARAEAVEAYRAYMAEREAAPTIDTWEVYKQAERDRAAIQVKREMLDRGFSPSDIEKLD